MDATVGIGPAVEVDIVAAAIAAAVFAGVLIVELLELMLVDWLAWRLFAVGIFEIVCSWPPQL